MTTRSFAAAAAILTLPLAAAAPAVAAAHHGRPPASHRVRHRPRTTTFSARVVRSSSSGLVVRTSTGRLLSFSPQQLRHPPARRRSKRRHGHHATHRRHLKSADASPGQAGNVVVNVLGLQPGMVVQITESVDAAGQITITITLPPSPQPQQASGVVTDVGDDGFSLQTADGPPLRLHMDPNALSQLDLSACDTVDVTYHQDAGFLIADAVQTTGSSASGDCAPTDDVTGVISQVSDGSLTISTDSGPLTFAVESGDVTDGFQPGALVDVSYTRASDGTLTATCVEYVEKDASGQVTAVSRGSLTITDADSGQSLTLAADPRDGVEIDGDAFNGVSAGDHVSLTYHEVAGELVADTVQDHSDR